MAGIKIPIPESSGFSGYFSGDFKIPALGVRFAGFENVFSFENRDFLGAFLVSAPAEGWGWCSGLLAETLSERRFREKTWPADEGIRVKVWFLPS